MTNTRKLTTMAILTALSVCFVALIHFPIFPAVAFLEYDPADIPILICGFAFGPAAGFIVTLIAAFIQGFTVSAQSGIYGIIMHIVATGAYVLSSSLFYRKHKTKKMAAVAIGIGTLTMVVHVLCQSRHHAVFSDGRGEQRYGVRRALAHAVHPAFQSYQSGRQRRDHVLYL